MDTARARAMEEIGVARRTGNLPVTNLPTLADKRRVKMLLQYAGRFSKSPYFLMFSKIECVFDSRARYHSTSSRSFDE
jgi:hypothetical protein